MRRRWAALALGPVLAAALGDCVLPGARVDPSVDAEEDAASDGAADAPDSSASGNGLVSLEDAAKVCSWVFSCPNFQPSIIASTRFPIDSTSYSDCVDELAGPIAQNRPGLLQQASLFQCAAKALSCPAAAACLAVEVIDSTDPRCQLTNGGDGCSQDGHMAIKCNEQFIVHCDNPAYYPGSSCVKTAGGEYWCLISLTCPASTTCSGTFATYCAGGSDQTNSFDCATMGWSCGTDKNTGEVHCLVDGVNPECTSPNTTTTCVGDHVRDCYGSAYGDVDCTAVGAHCTDQPFPHCERTSDTCKQSDPGLDQCSGNSISLCVGGQPRAFDCSTLSLKCVPGDASHSAYCG